MPSDEESWERGDSAVPEEDQQQSAEEQNETNPDDSYDPGHIQDVGSDDEDDGGDYDPESVGMDSAPVATEAPSPPRAASKPKMAGGFIVEASDDEDDSAPQTASADITKKEAAPTPGPDGFVPPPGIDPVMLFEARIKEDPRGDMDAWLHLMTEHRNRSRLDELRKVYHRFLEVFPQAVSEIDCKNAILILTTLVGRHLGAVDRARARLGQLCRRRAAVWSLPNDCPQH